MAQLLQVPEQHLMKACDQVSVHAVSVHATQRCTPGRRHMEQCNTSALRDSWKCDGQGMAHRALEHTPCTLTHPAASGIIQDDQKPHLSAGVCLQEAAKALCICSILKHGHAIKELIHLDDRAAIRPPPLEQLQSRKLMGAKLARPPCGWACHRSDNCKHTAGSV